MTVYIATLDYENYGTMIEHIFGVFETWQGAAAKINKEAVRDKWSEWEYESERGDDIWRNDGVVVRISPYTLEK